MSNSEKEKNEKESEQKQTVNLAALDVLNDKLDKTIERISELENKISRRFQTFCPISASRRCFRVF